MIRDARRSTSCRTCELTITVLPSAPSDVNNEMRRHALHGVGTVERFVEDQHGRVGHERGRDLGSLAHPLAEVADRAVGGIEEVDPCQCTGHGGLVVDVAEPRGVAHELTSGQGLGDRVLFGNEAELEVDGTIGAGVGSEHPHVTLVHREQATDSTHERRLAGSVRTEQPGHTRTERARDLGQRDLLTEPHRDVPDGHGGVCDEGRIGGHDRRVGDHVSIHR